MPKTLAQLNKQYHDLFYIEDKALFPLLVSMVVGAKLNAPAVWLYVIGASSGGKSTALSVFNKLPDSFSRQVSDLTPNTFLSGMKVAGKETSLLKSLGNNFVIFMKDFTTMISKADEAKSQIIAQMREIYDGHVVKITGNGQVLEWGKKGEPWKGTFIMASTEAIYKIQEEFSDMGTRAINYVLLEQDRKRTTRQSLLNKRNNEKFMKDLGELQDEVAAFVMEAIAKAPHAFDPISEELENEIIDVADLASKCRSVVIRDYRGEKSLALSAEYPMRMADQLLALAQFMTYINDGTLPDYLKSAVYKVAFDSIPKQRRMVLEIIAKHPKIQVVGAADQMNYPPNLVRAWIEDLNMFGIVERDGSGRSEYWRIKDEYRQTLVKYLGIRVVDYDLEGKGDMNVADAGSWEEQQMLMAQAQAFDEMPV